MENTEKKELPKSSKKWSFVGGESYAKFTKNGVQYIVANMDDAAIDAFVKLHEDQKLFVKL